ncbi:GapS1 family protein [Salmonella enterica]|uniref:GapS1 family protein n=1 Tax=Salmonella enterica TaxID=28901 RepID=UPI002C2325F8|nr:hypothetical protein [Salmonella enterica]
MLVHSESTAKHIMDSTRSRVQKVNPYKLISLCLKYNNKKHATHEEMMRHLPWIINLCIKWSAAVISTKRSFRDINEEQSLKLFQAVYSSLDFVPNGVMKKDGIDFFIRNIIYQQMIYQKTDALNTISRQAFLFEDLEKTHSIETKFKELTNVEIKDFLALSFVMISLILSNESNTVFTANSFAIIFDIIPKSTVIDFLNCLSIEQSKLQDFAKTNMHSTPLVEYYLPTPFIEKPFIKVNDEYLQVHPQLTSTSLQTFIYDLLRKNNAEEFMNKFGKLFEDCLHKLIIESKIKYHTEKDLIGLLPRDNKVVDFVIHSNESNIYIDVKGVEIRSRGMVTLNPKDISGSIKTSVLKAIRQSLEVHEGLDKIKSPVIPFREESYIICVTFKNLYLGGGKHIFNSYAKEDIVKIYEKFEEKHHIPYENIFCIAFEEFEYLLASCEYHKVEPQDVLRYVVKQNKNPSTSAFMLGQHLRDYFKTIKNSTLVNESGLRIINRITSKLSMPTKQQIHADKAVNGDKLAAEH